MSQGRVQLPHSYLDDRPRLDRLFSSVSMTLSLEADPAHTEIAASGESFEVTLTNKGSERLSFKIKCNNNAFYTFKPVTGIVGVGQTRKLEVARSYGPVSFDKIAINFLPAPIGVYDPLEPFKDAHAQPHVINVLVTVVYGPVSFDKIAINFLPAPIGVYDPLEPFKDAHAQPQVINVLVTASEKCIEVPTASDVAKQQSYVATLLEEWDMPRVEKADLILLSKANERPCVLEATSLLRSYDLEFCVAVNRAEPNWLAKKKFDDFSKLEIMEVPRSC
uniref:Major sperm protein n=1 Tax=Steinernema glaseri TaxID=37863 RepID=A0A1I8AGR6_9BILA